MNTIIISVEDVSMKAEVFDTATGQAILAALPFESTASSAVLPSCAVPVTVAA